MRRQDREVTEMEGIKNILKECRTCYLAMVYEEEPYVIPLNFAYEITEDALTLYFHSAKAGRKIDILRKNNHVCFTMSCEEALIFDEKKPCNTGYPFASVIGTGCVEFVEEDSEKCRVLTLLMKQHADAVIEFTPSQAAATCIYKVVSHQFTGKRKGGW